ncbi:MAG: hypothetical protein NTY53_23445, partial [Kiritimatiellaeota bacterium]|nr:hypothetical protein [Kiritimatiellota bacterium]
DELTGDGANATVWADAQYLAKLQEFVNLAAQNLPELLLKDDGTLDAIPALTLGGNWPWDELAQLKARAFAMYRFYLRDSEDARDQARAKLHLARCADYVGAEA